MRDWCYYEIYTAVTIEKLESKKFKPKIYESNEVRWILYMVAKNGRMD